MKKAIAFAGTIAAVMVITMAGCSKIHKTQGTTDPTVEAEDIASNSSKWKRFVETTSAGKEAVINFKQAVEDVKIGYRIEYKDGTYTYSDETNTKQYKYLLELSGTMPNASGSCKFTVLSNQKFTFDEIAESLYSSDSEKAFIDYQMIYTGE